MNNLQEETEAMDWLINKFGNWFSVQDIGDLVFKQHQNTNPEIPFVLWFNLFGKEELFENQSNNGYKDTEEYKDLYQEIYCD